MSKRECPRTFLVGRGQVELRCESSALSMDIRGVSHIFTVGRKGGEYLVNQRNGKTHYLMEDGSIRCGRQRPVAFEIVPSIGGDADVCPWCVRRLG